MPPTNPKKDESVLETILLIRTLDGINTSLENIKLQLQANNNTTALVIEQIGFLRNELKRYQEDAMQTRTTRQSLEYDALVAKDKDYQKELEQINEAQEAVRKSIEFLETGSGQTSQKIRAIAKTEIAQAIDKDKVDIRGIKISSRQFTYIIIGSIVLLLAAIILLPDAFSQILIRLAGMIGGVP